MGTLTELKKALTAAGATALQPYDLESVLHEELLALQPLAQMLSVVQAESKTHEYNVKTSHPAAWFEGESTGATVGNGAYARKSVQLKIQRIWGSVTGFAQSVDERFINALAEELSGSLQGMADLMEFGSMWGASDDIGFTGDAYQYSGILPRVFAYAPSNVVDGAGAKITLDLLDQTLAKISKFRQVRNDPRYWLMGLRMKQVVDGLQTKVQMPISSASFADGKIEMDMYGKAPIFETDFVVPADSTTSPALTSALAEGGTLVTGTAFQHQIASVTQFGEQVASSLSTARTTTGTTLSVTLTWTHDDNAKSYMIFRKVASGACQLIDIIPALTYDAAGKVNGNVETYTDTGAKTAKAIKPLASGEQQIAIFNANPVRGAAFVGKIDDMGRQVDKLVSFVELARTGDSYDYFLKSYQALRLIYPNLAAVVRHVKTA